MLKTPHLLYILPYEESSFQNNWLTKNKFEEFENISISF